MKDQFISIANLAMLNQVWSHTYFPFLPAACYLVYSLYDISTCKLLTKFYMLTMSLLDKSNVNHIHLGLAG